MSLCFGLVVCLVAQAQTAEMETAQSRIEHARSLAAVGNFTAAATELEAMRAETKDDAVRDVVRILLMGVYLTQSNYTRADALLEESFKSRTAGDENATRVYFALAGQLINGVRARLERYRAFGLNPASTELPNEARNDVEQLRTLLERVFDHAKTIRDDNAQTSAHGGGNIQGLDATALIEDAATVRLALARDTRERTRWQREIAEARQRLVGSDTTRTARAARTPVARPADATPTPAPAANQSIARTSAPATSAAPTDTPTQTAANSQNAPATGSAPPPASPAPSAPQQQNASASSNTSRPAAERKAAGAPISVGSLHDKATQRVSPNYPPAARSLRVTGVVTVYVVVNEQGVVENVQRLSGPNLLQQAAADAARRWRFKPTVIDGQPVRVSGYISFSFTL